MGVLVGAVQRGQDLTAPLTFVGGVAWLYDRLTEASVRPLGMGHLEDPKLTSDLAVAREFDTGMTGPPLSL